MSATSPARLHVVFVVTSMHGGGAEWVGRAWMSYLVQQGHRVSAVVTSPRVGEDFVPEQVEVVALGHLGGHPAKVAALRGFVLREHPDVLLGLQAYANLVLQAAAFSVPRRLRPATVVSERNLVSLGLPGAALEHRVKTALARRSYRRADHVIAISHPVAGELVSGFGVAGSRCTVVPNPAAAKSVPEVSRRPAGELDVEVLLANRMVSQKRPLLAVQVVAELARRGLDVRLTLFGTGPLLEQTVRSAAREGVRVDQRGWTELWFDDVTDKAVLLLASDREGFGNVLVEAAMAGIPSVAASSALGVADALVPGITGELAIDDSPAGLADAVERAVRIQLEPKSIEGWLERFSLAASGEALLHVLRKSLRSRS